MTENKKYTVLIIDDHPLILASYKRALDYVSNQDKTISFIISEASDCDTGYDKIKEYSTSGKNLDIVFLDISLALKL